ncbi:MAG TPA: PLP-dependent aminotransferase family protein [Alphaproteobacteria bacterium]
MPTLGDRSGPRYLAIADQLAHDLENGRLKPGDRLPTHRELAWKLGITVGTVTRAYGEAERRGLIAGEVGRGTFIRDRGVDVPLPAMPLADDEFIDLARNFPTPDRPSPAFIRTIADVAASPELGHLLSYATNLGLPTHRTAAVEWLARSGITAPPGEIVITNGAQHGMILAMAAVAHPGDVVLTEQLTFYGMKSVAALLSLRLHGVAIDEDGLIPEALDAACRQLSPKALYCIPTLQNPTAATMPAERRQAVAEICKRHGVMLVEDDIYGFLSPNGPKPVASIHPETSIYVTSLSKSLAPGLRVGYMRAPTALLDRLASTFRATTWMAAPLMAEVASRLVRSGEAARLAELQRAEAIARQDVAMRMLSGFEVATHPASFHLWLTLPEPWRREEFTAQIRRRGVGVASAEAFAVGRAPVPHAVRIGLSAARDRATLERALATITAVLREPPDRGIALV